MDADARGRALELRVAELELRMRRLELAQGVAQAAAPPAPSASPVPEAPRASPARAQATGPVAPSQELEWLGATRTSAGSPEPAPRGPAHARVDSPSRAAISLADLEARLTGRALAWVGGLALVLGAIFFLSLAFSRGWIGPEARVIVGLAAGALSLAAGAAFMDRGNRLLGHVLTPVGLAVISISLVGATRLYGLIPVELGLLLALVSSVAAAVIAVRADSPVVAAFGLVAVLAAPPLLGAPPDLATLAFVAVVLVGTTGVALWRSWPVLPTVAFVLAAPQVAVWITGRPDAAMGIVGLGAFWLINLVAAAGEEIRRHRDELSATSATLMLANAAFLVWAGFALLDGDLATSRGPFLALIAAAHLAVGVAFVRRDGDADLFGLLTIGTGLAALSMAAPVQFGANVIPIAWAAEAAALTWVAVRRGHPYSALLAGVLFLLAGAYLVEAYGPLRVLSIQEPSLSGMPGSLAFFVGATGVGLWFLRDRGLRKVAGAYGVVVVLTVLLHLDGVPLSVGQTAVLAIAAALPSLFELMPAAPIAWRTNGLIPAEIRTLEWRPAAELALPAALVLAGVVSTAAVIRMFGPDFDVAADGTPFMDPAGGALALYLVGLAWVAWLQDDERYREPIAAIGLIVTAWAIGRTFEGVAVVVGWSALVVAGFALWRGLRAIATVPRRPLGRALGIDPTADRVLPVASIATAVLAGLHLAVVELPILDLGEGPLPAVPFTDAGTLGAAALVFAVLLAGAIVGGRPAWRAPVVAAGAIFAYLVPFEVAPWAVVLLWAGLAVLLTAMSRRDPEGGDVFLGAALLMAGAAATVALDTVAPPSRLVVGTIPVEVAVGLQSIAALGAVTVALVATARAGRPRRWARWIGVIAGATFVYLASIALVDVVATKVGGEVMVGELQTWGQVGLSVLWAILGLAAFVGGLHLRFPESRHAGLVLLGLATVKVFLFDLAALDVAYRVISLIALGLLLLAGAWLWQRQQPGRDTPASGGSAPLTDEPPA